MLKKDITQERKERHHITQEDFTPDCIVEQMYSYFPDEVYSDFSKTVLDPAAGTGNLLIYVIKKRLENCKSSKDITDAVSTVYGTELMEDNTEECKERILDTISDFCDSSGIEFNENEIQDILNHNIVQTDMNDWDYDNWTKIVVNTLFDDVMF